MTTKTKKFDAVAESRKWKEAVARDTSGMSSAEVTAYFNAAHERYFAEREARRRHGRALVAAH